MRTRPDEISISEVNGQSIERDGHGYLLDPSQWDADVAALIAKEERLSLNDDHWMIISFMRDYFDEHGIPADARFVFSLLADQKGLDKKESRKLFFELFPYGYVKQSCKIAGMRQPRAWSTG
ncbi:MAG: TusE/DsrC/DsvC family sulfur relay protein [Hyphomicrobiaceae bacterium]|nr:TusE/DsrC/DsvC family sulfur relay protein [Hyphomicrobiaceae bacterium]